jgi:ATP-binding cassette subfamily B multidrug efflux pump
LLQQKTGIAVAHRLATIANMDRLLVLDEGHIFESGTQQKLISLGRIHATLWGISPLVLLASIRFTL